MSTPVTSLAAQTHRHNSQSGAHCVQFYSRDQYLIDQLERLIGSALLAGHSTIVIATGEHRERLSERLKKTGIDLTLAVEQQRYVPLDAADTLSTFMVNDQPSETRFFEVFDRILLKAKKSSNRIDLRLTVFGEMVALLWSVGKTDAAIQLEQLWNGLARRHEFDLACAYPSYFFDRPEHAESFLKVCSAHSALIPDESYTGLDGDDARLRAIVALQQKARALDSEVAEHKQLQLELEARIKTRTQELEQA